MMNIRSLHKLFINQNIKEKKTNVLLENVLKFFKAIQFLFYFIFLPLLTYLQFHKEQR